MRSKRGVELSLAWRSQVFPECLTYAVDPTPVNSPLALKTGEGFVCPENSVGVHFRFPNNGIRDTQLLHVRAVPKGVAYSRWVISRTEWVITQMTGGDLEGDKGGFVLWNIRTNFVKACYPFIHNDRALEHYALATNRIETALPLDQTPWRRTDVAGQLKQYPKFCTTVSTFPILSFVLVRVEQVRVIFLECANPTDKHLSVFIFWNKIAEVFLDVPKHVSADPVIRLVNECFQVVLVKGTTT